MSEQLDCVVVGAGVVGLAVSRALALAGREVVVLESEPHIGMHASSRNSEVIHAGLYYPTHSLKARLCVQGREMLYAYCNLRRINHRRLGKLIVATDPQDIDRLHGLREQAVGNGVQDLVLLSTDEVNELEPQVSCAAALLSPSTGIIDSHEFMTALQGDVEGSGGTVLFDSAVSNVKVADNGLRFESDGRPFACRTLVNAAGAKAQDLVRSLIAGVPQRYLAIGHYYAYQGKSPFRHLIYPLPSDGGLGIHATNDLSGAARFGPDVRWVDAINYDFDDSCRQDFVTAIRRYFKGVDENKLAPAYTGIRAKLAGPGAKVADFNIQGEAGHGVPGLVNLFGIESPGLTASLAIGEYVRAMLA
ncbi:MAG: NAD(P)/FAD-dependent oxidoreductase [Gammaproteobacteria bacterium]|nr:NAD(P)/FAD-dependent oxidoreductase [Gammaproteobacteria bacterium]MDH5305123.1 NAD(P)/FAD-dependent oxidoreductase [Gammaproteobacteria bacterium]